jgi:Icc-related predicted phosphoesterase
MIYFKGIEMNELRIDIFNIVGQKDCTLPEDGDKVFNSLKRALEENKKIVISFQNVEKLTTAFLNNAIGKLYKDFEEDKIKQSLSVENITESGKVRLKRVVTNAKNYFRNPDKMRESIKEILGEEDE